MKKAACTSILAAVAILAAPALAEPAETAQGTACNGSALNDISANFSGQPNNSWVTAPGDCTGVPDCGDYFDIACSAGGEEVLVSFCLGGGSFTGDPALLKEDEQFSFCANDFCGLGADMTYQNEFGTTTRIYLDAGDDLGYTYTVAVFAPPTCDIVGAVPVELQSFSVE